MVLLGLGEEERSDLQGRVGSTELAAELWRKRLESDLSKGRLDVAIEDELVVLEPVCSSTEMGDKAGSLCSRH